MKENSLSLAALLFTIVYFIFMAITPTSCREASFEDVGPHPTNKARLSSDISNGNTSPDTAAPDTGAGAASTLPQPSPALVSTPPPSQAPGRAPANVCVCGNSAQAIALPAEGSDHGNCNGNGNLSDNNGNNNSIQNGMGNGAAFTAVAGGSFAASGLPCCCTL